MSSSSAGRAPLAPAPTPQHTSTPAATAPPPPPATPYQPPLLLTVRFSSSIPDMLLDIQFPSRTTVVALKHLIRSSLAQPDSQRRLRFIHGGRILPDAAVLAAVLRAPPPPPPGDQHALASADPKGKGKAVEGRQATQRVYVNCSIGDSLTDAELAAEATAAAAPLVEDASVVGSLPARATTSPSGSNTGEAPGRRGPRGFDRLLSAGFTPAEVNQLRLQFQSIRAARYTPDTMPSPDSLRTMEDNWIDNNSAGAGAGGGGAVGDADAEDLTGMNAMADVMLRAMVIGFVWPLGSIMWLVREPGLWSRRWKLFVSFGFTLSLLIGMIRALSGDK